MEKIEDVETFDSPGWWLHQLSTELHERRAGIRGKKAWTRGGVESSDIRPPLTTLAAYLRGDPPLRSDIHQHWASEFRTFLRIGRMNVAPMLVSAPANRLTIRDFRTAAAADELGDVEARRLMKRNKLRRKAREVHDSMLGLGDGYTIVTPPDDTRAWSAITAESPLECITAEDPVTGETVAGLKMFHDPRQHIDYAYLFLPGQLWVARCEVPTSTLFRRRFSLTDRWGWDMEMCDDVPGDRVAMVRFRNKDGVSEIEGHLNDLDRINDKLFNEWWIGKMQAFKQRAIEMPDEKEEHDTASPDPDDDEDDDELTDEELSQMFVSAPDALWRLPKGAKIWESSTVDTTALVNSVKAELQWLAATSHNPLHTITPDAANGSAEGATLQREEHVFKIQDRRDRASDSWAETLGMAFLFQGDTERSDVSQIEAMFGPLELLSLAEKATAAANLKGILPWETLLTDVLQYEPGDVVDRVKPQRAQDLLYAANLEAAGAAAPGPGSAPPVVVDQPGPAANA